MIPKSMSSTPIGDVKRFPACAKPLHGPIVWINASAGVGRSDRIMRKQMDNAGESWTSAIAVLFVGSIIALAHELGPQARHMGLHILSMNVLAPALAALAVTHRPERQARPRWLWLAAATQIVALWAAHTPALQHAAMTNSVVQAVTHGALLAAALSFWTLLLRLPLPQRWHAIPVLLLTGKLVCLLAVLLVFAPRTLYGASHGVAALDDQHLAGLLMIAACPLGYLVAAIVITVQLVYRDAPDPSWQRPARSAGSCAAP
jgi:putative membrane protein